jgi:hypothetical protein
MQYITSRIEDVGARKDREALLVAASQHGGTRNGISGQQFACTAPSRAAKPPPLTKTHGCQDPFH